MLRLRPRLSTKPVPSSSAQTASEPTRSSEPNRDFPVVRVTGKVGENHSQTEIGIFETPFIGFFECAADGRFTRVNAALARMFGYRTPEEFIENMISHGDLCIDGEREEEYSRQLRESGSIANWELRLHKNDRTPVWIEENARAICDETGVLLRVEGTMQDISRHKQREAELLRHAFHDKLTGLPDRALFLERVERCIKRRERRQSYWFAVLFLDLDRFKIVNDSLGHSAGDQLLIAAAQKLESSLRPGDTVARLGGDEFAILLDDIQDLNDAIRVAERIQYLLSAPSILDGHEVYTSASIGIALISRAHESPDDVLRDADTAMYRAKAAGKARHAIFDAEMHAVGKNMLQLESDLRHALNNREFYTLYQPIVALNSGRIVGFETFLRWQHPTRGLVPPSEFVGIAEETGLLVAIDRWVLGEACRKMAAWQALFPAQTLLTISVNLSSRQFTQTDLLDELERILRRAGLSPRSLRLEMTEKSLLANPDSAQQMLERLNVLGVQMSLDDFGTGYSSLAHLHRFAFDALKIDRSFIERLEDPKNEEIVRAIINIAQNLNMTVVAEGVETPEQLAKLREMNCHSAQGYLFSDPLDSQAALDLISTNPLW